MSMPPYPPEARWKAPAGTFEVPERYDYDTRLGWIRVLEALPSWLDVCLQNLDEAQLHSSYREGGWNVNQIIHHLADSHMQAYARHKWALTEENPTIKPYDQDAWAGLPDNDQVPANVSVTLLHALHRRWGGLLRVLRTPDWERSFYHPEEQRAVPLWESVAKYAWHGRHHVGQIELVRERFGL